MTQTRKIVAVWLVVTAVLAVVLVPLGRPMLTAWRCYWQNASGEPVQARVVSALEAQALLVLRIESGPHAGDACTATAARSILEAAAPGERFDVVYGQDRTGVCQLQSTISASGRLLAAMTAAIAVLIVGVVGAGLFFHRAFTAPVRPARHLVVVEGDSLVRCPACGKPMDEGYVPLLSALHWRKPGEPIGMPHPLRGLPGTVGWRGRPRLHAFRCAPCEILTLQYGAPERR